MKTLVLVLLILISFSSYGQQNIEKSCHTNMEVVVVVDSTFHNIDSIIQSESAKKPGMFLDFSWFCDPCYSLRPLDQKYKVISFKITSDSRGGDIVERNYTGTTMGSEGRVQIKSAVRNSIILISCIKARHENGNIYTLKNVTLRR